MVEKEIGTNIWEIIQMNTEKKCDLKKKEHDEIRFKNQASIKTLGILSEPVNLK